MIISIMAFTLVFSVIVLIHESGHFIAARIYGVKVYEFSIGFPFSPRVCTLFRHKETDFTLRLLPLGGFVSFSKEGDEDALDLFGSSYFRRAAILLQGSLFNIVFAFILFTAVFMAGKNLSFMESVSLSAKTMWEILSATASFLMNILAGNGVLDGLAGPVGIASMAGQAAGKGVLTLIYFTGVLSMSLGIINLLPFPALDGGQLLMVFIETIRKRPLPIKTYQVFNLVGFALFIILAMVVTYRDVMRLIA